MVLLIMVCALIGTVLLIGLCGPLSAAGIPASTPIDAPSSGVIVETFRGDRDSHINCEDSESGESIREDSTISDLRVWIASSSIPILRSRGMTDEEIKAELLRDFSLTEEQIDEILAAR